MSVNLANGLFRQGAALTLVPWVLVFFGPQIRARSKLASVSPVIIALHCMAHYRVLTWHRNSRNNRIGIEQWRVLAWDVYRIDHRDVHVHPSI